MSDGTGPVNVTFGSKRCGRLSNRSESLGAEEADELLEWEYMETGEVALIVRGMPPFDNRDPLRLPVGALRTLLDFERVLFRTFDHKVDIMEAPLAARLLDPSKAVSNCMEFIGRHEGSDVDIVSRQVDVTREPVIEQKEMAGSG